MKQKQTIAVILIAVLVATFYLANPIKSNRTDPFRKLHRYQQQPQLHISSKKEALSTPVLHIKNDREKSLQMQRLKLKVFIENGMARTRYDMVFENPHDRILEGELQFPLHDGQIISYFALEIDGEMRPGVAVERTKARVAYEATVRKGIDPGLVEKIQGNQFKLRIFPVPSKGTKRVIIETLQVLQADPQRSFYQLPLQCTNALEQFQLDVYCYRYAQAPIVRSSFGSKQVLKTKSKRLYRYSQKRYRFKPTGQLVLQFPAKSASVIVAQQRKDSTFFKADLQLPLRYARKKAPRCLTVCWDVSLSRSQSQLQKEKQLLKRYLHYMHEGRVELLVFAHKVLLRNFVTVKNGRAPALFACLDQQDYDGATALSQLPFQTMRGDEILVFTDGMQSMGSVPINACVTPIHVIQSSLRADEGPLRAIAKASHGTFCSLTQQSLDQAFFMLCTQSLQFLGFSTQKQLKNTTILEGSGAFGVLNVTGVLSGKPSHLTANYGLGKRIIHSERLSITYQTNPQNEGAIYEKVWALSRVQELEQEPKRNKDTLLQLGLKYKLPTDQTSLLVLDAVEDYVAHEIVPPKSMQKKYWHLVHLKHRADKKALADHWENLKKDWKDYRFWYAHPNYKRNRSKNELPNINQALPQESRAQASPSSVQETETTITESNFMISTDSIQVSAANSYSWTPTFSGATSGTYTYRISSMPFTAATNVTNGCATVNPDAASLPQAHLKIAAWNPKMPYLIALKKVPLKKAYACYLNLRKNYQDQPSFYIDVCDYFLRYHENESAMRILSNLAEMQLQDASLLRILAQKLMQVKASQLAMPLFKELIDMRPDEPQSYRDYGLALASIGQYQEAIEQLYKVVEKPFDPRFTGIDLIALNEINHLYFTHQKELNVAFIEPVFLQKMQYDIRVVLSWDANDTDVDLWVNEPYGEKCMYSYKNTKNGGRISNDFTQGYGPEEYLIKQAPKGEYRIQAHYYGDHRASLNGKAQLTIQFYLHYGTPFEVKKEVTRRLQVVDQEIDLATFEF